MLAPDHLYKKTKEYSPEQAEQELNNIFFKKSERIYKDIYKKSVIESLMLCGIENSEICDILNLPIECVETYKEYFFDIKKYDYLDKFSLVESCINKKEYFYKKIALKYGKNVLICCLVGQLTDDDLILEKVKAAMYEMFFEINMLQEHSEYAKQILVLYKAIDKGTIKQSQKENEKSAEEASEKDFDAFANILSRNFTKGMVEAAEKIKNDKRDENNE